MGNEIDPVTVEELDEARRRRKKKILRLVSSFLSVILIPVILTVVLAAYEDETNEWVRNLFEGEKKETYMESLKRLASEGNMPEYECGALGSGITNVINRCGEPIARKDTYDVSSTMTSLYYQYGDHKLVHLNFENDRLKAIKVMDESKESLSVDEMKRVFGTPVETAENQTNLKSDTVYYQYLLSVYDLMLNFSKDTGKLKDINLETREKFGYTGSPRTQFETEVHPVDQAKRISSAGGVKVAKQLHEWISQGDLGNYDCGPLGTAYHDVLSGKCGTYQNNVSHKEANQQNNETLLKYQFKDREIKLKFFNDVLTSISIREFENSIPVTKDDIIQVFGKPAPKKSPAVNFGTEIDSLTYQINGNKVQMFFDEEGKIDYLWFFKEGLYDEEFGFLLPQKK